MAIKVSVAVLVLAADGNPAVSVERTSMVLNPDPRQPDADPDLAKAKLEEFLGEIGTEASGQLEDWQKAIRRITS